MWLFYEPFYVESNEGFFFLIIIIFCNDLHIEVNSQTQKMY